MAGRSPAAPLRNSHSLLPASTARPQAYWGEPEKGWMGMFTHQVGGGRALCTLRLVLRLCRLTW